MIYIMEILNSEFIKQQKANVKQLKLRKALGQIQKWLDREDFLDAQFVFDVLIIEQKVIVKLLNKNIFNKNMYQVGKMRQLMSLVNRNLAVLHRLTLEVLKEVTRFSVREPNQKPDKNVPDCVLSIMDKVINIFASKCPVQKFFQTFLLVSVTVVNTLKKYDAYWEAYQTAKGCYQFTKTLYFPDNIVILRKAIEIKMVYGSILFQLGEWSTVILIQEQVVNDIMELLCSNMFMNLKSPVLRDKLTERLWKQLIVSIMVNLSSCIHNQDYPSILRVFKLFSSAVNDISNVGSPVFRKCIIHVLNSVGAILRSHIQVVDQLTELYIEMFPVLHGVCNEINKKSNQDSQQTNDTISSAFQSKTKTKNNTPGQLNTEQPTSVPMATSTSKQKNKLMRSFIQDDCSFNVSPLVCVPLVKGASLKIPQNQIKTLESFNRSKGRTLKKTRVLNSSCGNVVSSHGFSQHQVASLKYNLLNQDTHIRRTNYYSSVVKKQFQMKSRQNRIIENSQQTYINLAEMKRNISQTSKFIEATIGDMSKPSQQIYESIIHENDPEDIKQEGVNIFMKTIIQHKDFLGINKLLQKHQLVKKKRENLAKKKIEKIYRAMSIRRNSKFQDVQLSNILKGENSKYIGQARALNLKYPGHNGEVIHQRQQSFSKGQKKGSTPVEYASKVQALINLNYTKSQEMIKKFSTGIQHQIQLQEAPNQNNRTTKNNNWILSQKFFNLDRTVVTNQTVK